MFEDQGGTYYDFIKYVYTYVECLFVVLQFLCNCVTSAATTKLKTVKNKFRETINRIRIAKKNIVCRVPKLLYRGAECSKGVCSLGLMDDGTWSQGMFLESKPLYNYMYSGKVCDLRFKTCPFDVGSRIGLVLRGSKLHGYGLVVGEATIEGSHKINPQQWILDNYDKHFYDGEKQFTWVWHLSNIVRYDVYRHLQGSQTPVFLYNLHEYTLLIKK